MDVIIILIVSFVLTFVFALAVKKFFPKLRLMDKPEKYGLSRKPIPYPGGLAIFLAFMITILSYFALNGGMLDARLSCVLLGATLLAVTCFIDDRRGLSPFLRLAVQFFAGLILVFGGIGVASISNPFGDPIVLDSLKIPFSFGDITFTFTVFADILTILWVMTMVNAFNWIDGVPGMASSTGAVASLILLALSMRSGFHSTDQTLAILLSATLLACCLAFLIFDFPKPKMLMGDTGSMFIGFILATTALISGGKIATTVLVLGFPILDFAWVIFRRLLKGKSPFKGDLWHFHHRFLKAGYSEGATVVFFASASLLFGLLALLLRTEGKVLSFALVFAVMVTFATLLYSRKGV